MELLCLFWWSNCRPFSLFFDWFAFFDCREFWFSSPPTLGQIGLYLVSFHAESSVFFLLHFFTYTFTISANCVWLIAICFHFVYRTCVQLTQYGRSCFRFSFICTQTLSFLVISSFFCRTAIILRNGLFIFNLGHVSACKDSWFCIFVSFFWFVDLFWFFCSSSFPSFVCVWVFSLCEI